jgi:dTDP-4-amino-4,6-dideoxygalactose transaminase
MNPFSPWPSYSENEVAAVSRVLRSNQINYWTGDVGRAFEREFADFVGTPYAIALANGTMALELALRAVGVSHGDEVVVTPRTFIATVSAIVNAGATPIFADVDLDSQNLTAATISRVLSPRTRAIMCVHLAGWPCDMDPIMAMANERGIAVIEDCAQAHGARYKGRAIGSIGHIGCWSFCQDKIIGTGGEGGMVTTSDHALWSRMWSYKDHGKSWRRTHDAAHPPGFRWLVESFGTNARLTEMQAAIGRVQLERLPEWNRRRRQNAERIWQTARKLPLFRAPFFACGGCSGDCSADRCSHAFYKCYLFVNGDQKTRDRVMTTINEMGVPCSTGSCPEVYLERAFDGTGLQPAQRLPNAQKLGETSLMFLCHPTLTDDEVARTCMALEEVAEILAPC